MIDPRTLEKPVIDCGEIGRGLTNITPEQVNLSGYKPWEVMGQTVFPLYGGTTPCNARWRAWYRDGEDGTRYFIAFEDVPTFE